MRAAWWWMELLARFGVGIVLFNAGLMKAGDPREFATDIENYRIVGKSASVALAIYLPWLEMAVGLALITGLGRRGASLLALLMMLVFTGALVSAWARNLDITCGCFGARADEIPWAMMVARNALLALAAGYVFVRSLRRTSHPPSAEAPRAEAPTS